MTEIPITVDMSGVLGPRSAENPFGFVLCRRGLLALDERGRPLGFATDELGQVTIVMDTGELFTSGSFTTEDLRETYPSARFVRGRCSEAGIFEAT
jgi:hypothetical protein